MGASTREADMRRRGTGGRPSRWVLVVPLVLVALVVVLMVRNAPGGDAPGGDASGTEPIDASLAAFGIEDDPFLGDPDAPVVLVGYESPHCSSCQYFHTNLLPGIHERFIATGEVVYYYIQGTIGGDLESSIAQECAYEHGGNDAFWGLADRLYGRSSTYATPDWHAWLDDLAAEHGIDADALRACYDERATQDRVQADLAVGRDHGARATPTFWAFEGGRTVKIGSMNGLEAELERLVAAAA